MHYRGINMNETAIKVENISKMYRLFNKQSDKVKQALGLTRTPLYREYYALSNIDFEVKKGECVGIIGTNGAGKSTLLKIITGVLKPSTGSVFINGRVSALLELGAGFNMEYTGLENVYINGRMTGFSKKEVDEKLKDILEFADIGDFIYQPVKTYSSGMFVRLAFAVAINIEPEILIVDEALSVGDIFFQAKCFRKFEEFKKNGKTILFVSHAMVSIQKYCDRAILLNKGQKIAEDTPKVIIDLYNKLLVEDPNKQIQPTQEKRSETNLLTPGKLWKEQMVVNHKALEYGNKAAEIIDFCICDKYGNITNNIAKGDRFSIKIKVVFHTKIKNPIVAFTIKDLKGTELTGTNTKIENKVITVPAPNKIVTVTFEQEMNLQSYEYLLALGCTGFVGDELLVYHRLYDICHIMVMSNKNSVGIYDMNSTVTLE